MCHLLDCVQLSLVPVAYLSVVQHMCLLLFNHGKNKRAVRAPKFAKLYTDRVSSRNLVWWWWGGGGGGGGGGGQDAAYDAWYVCFMLPFFHVRVLYVISFTVSFLCQNVWGGGGGGEFSFWEVKHLPLCPRP